jgi:transcriptional regulator with GAF, ATPase, and Fis domain
MSQTAWKSQLNLKLMLFSLLSITAVLAAMGAYQHSLQRKWLSTNLTVAVESAATRLSTTLIHPLWNLDLHEALVLLKTEMSVPDVEAIVVESENKTFLAAVAKKEGKLVELTGWEREDPLAVASTSGPLLSKSFEVRKANKTFARGEVLYARTELDRSLRNQLTLTLVQIALVDGFLVAVLFAVLSSLVLRPLKVLASEASLLREAVSCGKLDVRADEAKVSEEFRPVLAGMNEIMEAFVAPIAVASTYLDRISKGDVPPKLTEEYRGDFNSIKNNLNQCIEAVTLLISDAGMLSRAATEGKLAVRADATKHQGDFRRVIEGVNETMESVIGPLNTAVRCVDGISKGRIPPKITARYSGDFNTLKDNLNQCIESVNRLVSDARTLSKAAAEGKPAAQADATKGVSHIRRLKHDLSQKLQEMGLTTRYCFDDIKTHSSRMNQCIEMARRIADSDFTVLIIGESGTGKELLAQSIHTGSSRGKQPFVAVNCAAVPESLLESELFGYEGGSFTGALKEGKAGLFEQAQNGTVFLDEIGDMPLPLQAKLLRVLQERQVTRVGAQKVTSVNIRVIAATNRDLREKIRAGQFREDLYYRLNVLPLTVPPLRERTEDILPLLEHFLQEHRQSELSVTPETKEILLRYSWPGNIRELGNVASYVSFTTESQLSPQTLPHYILSDHASLESDAVVIKARGGLDRSRAVLEVLEELEALHLRAGRKSLEEALSSRGASLSEAEVRAVLSLLNELTLVRSGLGRRGSELTLRGKLFLNWLRNR